MSIFNKFGCFNNDFPFIGNNYKALDTYKKMCLIDKKVNDNGKIQDENFKEVDDRLNALENLKAPVTRQYVDLQDEKMLNNAKEYADTRTAKNFIVNTYVNPINPKEFYCDYSYNEIRNALIHEKNVVMYFEDTIEKSGNQVYPFLKLTNDGAYFRRLQITKENVRQIDIKVDNGKRVTFSETFYNGNLTVSKTLDTSTITSVETFRTYFYNLRKSNNRIYQFEIEQGVNENIVNGIGGLPLGITLKDKAFIYVEIPYSEAGGFLINITYMGRTSGKLYKKAMFSTLDSNWKEIAWYSLEDIAGQFNALNDEINLSTEEISDTKATVRLMQNDIELIKAKLTELQEGGIIV